VHNVYLFRLFGITSVVSVAGSQQQFSVACSQTVVITKTLVQIAVARLKDLFISMLLHHHLRIK